MKAILVIILLSILFSSCRPTRILTRYETTEIETMVRDIPVTLRVPPVIISQGIIIDTLKPDQSILETEFCLSRIYWDEGLQHELRQKEARRDTIIQVEYVNTTTTIKEPYEVNILTWWQRLWINVGRFLSAVILLWVLWFLFVKRFKI